MTTAPSRTRRVPAPARRIADAWSLAIAAAPGKLAVVGALALVAGLLPPATAWLTKTVLDRLAHGAPAAEVLSPAVGLAVSGLLIALIPQLTKYLRGELERAVGLVTQERLFTAVDRFTGIGRFEDPAFLDRLRLAQQAGRSTPNEAVDGTLGLLKAAVIVTGFVGSLMLLSPVMSVLVLIAGLPTFIAQISLARSRAGMYWAVGPDERREIFYGHLLSSVEAAKEIRLFCTGGFLRERMLTARRTVNVARRSVDRRELRLQSGLCGIASLVSGGGLIWAALAARGGALSLGDVTVFVAAVAGVQGAMTTLATETARVHHALIMFDHYVATTTAEPDLPVPSRPAPVPPLRHHIELRDVWFRYSDQHDWVLRGVSLRIPYGGSLALVGLNGAGKSTLVKLLCRLYDPTRGAVLWDGTDIRDVDPSELRRRIGAVFQDYMHYDMTAAENIALGDLDALGDRDRIRDAARRAGIHTKLARLPQAYDTLLSRMFLMESDKDDPETGVVLSGGQWQRLALARAFLRDRRDFMILDEPSAGLDAEAEHEIHTSIRAHRAGRTSLLISHRLGAVRDADTIVVLSGGRIAEQGDHGALMQAGGEYARLFALQAVGYQEHTQDDTTTTPVNAR
ncbi:ABC transporter ATP-binding protein [Streptomyces sp. NPDC059786]|uniref:ABC transporter ATP-binding protein n=1 Tax=Streptomyces sp. NPDC059786 TaxID=3346946 RepID=UPI003666CEAC